MKSSYPFSRHRPISISPLVLLIWFAIMLTTVYAKLVRFEVDLTWETYSPDGNAREMVLMNGQFPGPLLELNVGDDVEFTMNNHLPFNCTIHFHGIDQMGTPWSDGVPGLAQKPTPPQGTFVYKWTANQYGSYMYHAHAQSLISDGLYGPIFIHPQADEPSAFSQISSNPADLKALQYAEQNSRTVMLGDWTKYTSQEVWEAEQASNLDLYCANSVLVNGKGAVNCQSVEFYNKVASATVKTLINGSSITDIGCLPPLPIDQGNYKTDPSKVPPGLLYGCEATTGRKEVFNVDPSSERWISFNLINAASLLVLEFSIDSHPLWVYAVDGVHNVPQLVDSVNVANGERYSCMVKLGQPSADYVIRTASTSLAQLISGYATLSYTNGHGVNASNATAFIDYSGALTSTNATTLNINSVAPYPPEAYKPAPKADALHVINMGRINTPYIWGLSVTQAYPPFFAQDDPLLFYPNGPDGMNANLTIRTNNNTWVDLVLQVNPTDVNPLQPAHPIHKHSTKAYILGTGTGSWTWQTVDEAVAANPTGMFNFDNPPYRDMFNTAGTINQSVWTVVRYYVSNPGPWLIHCHIQTHLQGGMAVVLMDGVDAWPTDIPPEYRGDDSVTTTIPGPGQGQGQNHGHAGGAGGTNANGGSVARKILAQGGYMGFLSDV